MTAQQPIRADQGVTLRQAALIAGFAMLVMAATPFAEFYVLPRLIVPGDVEATVRNILGNRGLFVAGMIIYFTTFVADVVVAWALYVLLVPVNRSVSVLTAWFRLVYTVIAFVALLKLFSAFRLLNEPNYLQAVGPDQLHAQVQLLLSSFRYEWSLSLVLFGIHLGLLGYLVFRSGYIPRILGILLAVAGFGYVIYSLGPYLYPKANVDFLFITFLSEPIFTFWLLIRGWKIEEPAAPAR